MLSCKDSPASSLCKMREQEEQSKKSRGWVSEVRLWAKVSTTARAEADHYY